MSAALLLVILLVLGPAVQAQQAVTGFTLVNADTDLDIGPLVEGDTLDLAALPTRNLSVRADTDPSPVGSVRFAYDGNPNYQTESIVPYAIAGDNSGDYNPWTPSVGAHTLTATPYTEASAGGTAGTPLTVNFTVVDDGGGGEPPVCDPDAGGVAVDGELKRWHPVTLTFGGPCAGEAASPNPFRDYRLTVTFSHAGSGQSFDVPGYFAADGDAAETGATTGTKWRVHFTPSENGSWTYAASFRTGTDVALSSDPLAGTPADFDGASGGISIAETDKTGRDHRGKGHLRYAGTRYLQFENGDVFLKGGADSPENFLAYQEFDGTYNHGGTDYTKTYTAHVADWQSGDPSWQGGKGKGIVGAVNYLAYEGMNGIYFLTMNVNGDGKDVWPWTSHTERYRFDVSKLDQWNLVFDQMDRQGVMLHILTQETENDQLLDGGALGPERTLYYRELIARFGHHLAVTWNLGEENTNTDAERKAFVDFFTANDPYDHPIVVHTYPGSKDAVYNPLLAYPGFDGPSLQMGSMNGTHSETKKWIDLSVANGRPWFVSLDEIGPANTGVTPDGAGNNHADVRHYALWGNLMAGGAGVEWYFGYNYPHSDLTCQDWRSRDQMWDYTRHALEFFHTHLPFTEMTGDDGLTSSTTDYVFAKAGEVYAVYLPDGGTTDLTLPSGSYDVRWYNPRAGGALQTGSVVSVSGPGAPSIGQPPVDPTLDWVALVTAAGPGGNQPPVVTITAPDDGATFTEGTAVGFTGSALDPEDGDLGASIAWSSNLDGNLGSGGSISVALSVGTHQITASATDAGSPPETGTDQITVTVEPGAGPTDLHVASVSTGSQGAGKRKKVGTASVVIVDDLGNPVAGATVTGDFGGSIVEPGVSAVTGADGTASFTTAGTTGAKNPTITFCVSDVAHGTLPYDPSDNAPGTSCAVTPDPTSFHIAGVSSGTAGAGKGQKRGTAVVTIRDDVGNAVEGVVVTGEFGGSIVETPPSGTTGADGAVRFETVGTAGGKVSVTFCVSGVSYSGLPYEPADDAPGATCTGGASSATRGARAELMGGVPVDYALDQNYPNPFNPTTVIAYRLPEAAHVTLEVYDAWGRRITTLVDRVQDAGRQTATFEARDLPSGVYLYILRAGAFTASRSMLLLR